MSNFLDTRENSSELNQKVFSREKLIMAVTEELLIAMERQNISKIELAKKLGKSKSYVTQVLSGARNMTLRTLSDFCFVLGVEPSVCFDGVEAMSQSREISQPKKSWEKSDSVTNQKVVDFSTWRGRKVSVIGVKEEGSDCKAFLMVNDWSPKIKCARQ